MNQQLIITGTGNQVELAQATANNLLAIYKPELTRQLQNRLNSAVDLIKPENNTPSIGYVRNKLSETLINGLIKLHILDLADFVNPSRNMTESQIDTTADMIVNNFPNMKIADIIFIFKKAKMGAFGALYEGLDGAKILSWFNQTWNERLEAAEMMSDMEHQNTKQGFDRRSSGIDNGLKKLINKSITWQQMNSDQTSEK